MTLPVLLLAAAAVVLLARPSPARRLGEVLPRQRHERTAPRWLPMVAFASAAAALAWGVGGLFGLLLAAALLVLGPRLVARLDDSEDDSRELAVQLPLALDLLAACLAGGATLRAAVTAVRDAVPGPCGDRLARVAAELEVGTAEHEAFRALGDDGGPGGAAARALARAAEGGTPVAGAIARVAAEARRSAAAEAERRAKRAGVLAVAPLGVCFLPAFMLLGVVPAVIGLATPLITSL